MMDHFTAKRIAFGRTLILAGLLVMSSACRRSVPPPQPEPVVKDYLEHTVSSGETLAVIADWYTGSSKNWQAIRDENPGLDPTRMRPGDVVLVPRSMVVKETPLPRSRVKKAEPTPTPAVEEAVAVPTETVTVIPTPESAIPDVPPATEEPTPAGTESAPLPSAAPTQAADATLEIPTAVVSPAPSPTSEGRIKTRDDFLREMLEETR